MDTGRPGWTGGRVVNRRTTKVVGWTEVWSTTPGEGFKVEGVVALVAPKRSSRKALAKPKRRPAA